MRTLLVSVLSLPAAAAAHPGHGGDAVFHWHGAELALAVATLLALLYLLRR